MEQFNKILSIINDKILLTIIGVAFGIQVIYLLLFFVKAKTYPTAQKKHKFAIIIPARNEADVIVDTIKCILASDYPRELFDIYVVADNCTDNTAELAEAAGATVYRHFDDDPKHHLVGYALKFLFEKLMEEHRGEYEAFIRFDADALMEHDYISRMNDAYDAGVKSARGYSNAKNIGQNVVAGISGLWYIRDCRFQSNFRSAIGQSTTLTGSGMMFAAEIIEKHGWDCLTAVEDQEFAMRRLNQDKIKTMYVKDAMVYEDQPATVKETFKRYTRMGRALNSLFFTQGLKSFGLFFVRWKWSYIDMFITLLFIPVCVIMCIWLPIYYGYVLIYNGIMGNWTVFWQYLSVILYALAFAFVAAFILQALLCIALEHKKIKAPVKKLIPVAFAFPIFMIIYAAAITVGVFRKPKWKKIKRNVGHEDTVADALLASAATADDTAPETADTETEDSVKRSADVTGSEISGEAEIAETFESDDADGTSRRDS